MQSITLSDLFTEAEAERTIRETTNSVVKIDKLIPWLGVGSILSGIISALVKSKVESKAIPCKSLL